MAEGGTRHKEEAQRLPTGKRGAWGRELPEDPARGAVCGHGATYPGDHEQHQLSLFCEQ